MSVPKQVWPGGGGGGFGACEGRPETGGGGGPPLRSDGGGGGAEPLAALGLDDVPRDANAPESDDDGAGGGAADADGTERMGACEGRAGGGGGLRRG